MDEWMKKIWYTYTMEYDSAIIKEGSLAICDTMDELQGYYAKWNKSDRGRQIMYDFTLMWNLEKPNS